MPDKDKKPFDVKVEVLVPTTITYRVNAIDEKDAIKEAEKLTARKISTNQNHRRAIKLKATVYLINSNMIKLSKTYRHL